MSNQLMAGKRGLIMGLANDKSIAWGIAKACADAGAELAFSYQGEALKKRVDPLAGQLGSDIVLPCDVGDEASIDGLFGALKDRWDSLDFIVHAIGFSDKSELRGRYVDTSKDNFAMTMDISVYSFTSVMQRAEKMMTKGGSAVTLTYYGAEKVMPHYNVMGVAKAALEASVRYLAEDLGKKNIRVNAVNPTVTMTPMGKMAWGDPAKSGPMLANIPLGRFAEPIDVSHAVAYLLSEQADMIHGVTLPVDGGFLSV